MKDAIYEEGLRKVFLLPLSSNRSAKKSWTNNVSSFDANVLKIKLNVLIVKLTLLDYT